LIKIRQVSINALRPFTSLWILGEWRTASGLGKGRSRPWRTEPKGNSAFPASVAPKKTKSANHGNHTVISDRLSSTVDQLPDVLDMICRHRDVINLLIHSAESDVF